MLSELLLCPESESTLWGFLDPSIAPTLMYYAYGPIVLISLFFGFFVFIRDKRSFRSSLLLILAITFSLAIANEVVQWIATPVAVVHFAWSLVPIFQIAVLISAAYFLYVFSAQKDISFNKKLVFALLAVPFVVLTPTRFNYSGFDLQNCEAINGPLWEYIYIFNILIFVLSVFFLYRQWKENRNKVEYRHQTQALIIGTILFFGAFIFTNVIGDATRVYEFNLFGPIGMVGFIATMSFIIVRYKAFNLKIIGAQILVIAIWLSVFSILFIRRVENVRIVTIAMLVLLFVVGILLTRSVRREVEQKEQLANLNTQLSAANEKLKVLDEQKSQFVSFASHDLKSPINIIKQFASLIADGTYKEPKKVQETILKIKDVANRATQLVDDFLDVRKIEEGKFEYTFETKNIVEFTKEITEDYAPVAKANKNLDLTFTAPPATPVINVKIDTTRMRQVIQNLLSNSVKYTEKGWIKVMVTEEHASVLISVKDSGLGMSTELLPNLFEQFHRDKNVAKKIQGTGLGLYISKQMVLAHGGEIWAESEGPGKGSTFYVRLKKA